MSSLFLLLACATEPVSVAPPQTPTETPESAPPTHAGPPPADQVRARVEEARTRLESSPAGVLMWRALEAHGGLDAWHGAGTLAFDFDYRPLGKPDARRWSRNTIDLWSARARHEELPATLPASERAVFGWDGQEAWIQPDADAFPSSARFWSLTPYYFVGMPFVLADPGVNLEQLPDAPLDGVTHHLVRATFGDDVGDAPDDYYILYLHPDTGRVGGLRYVVSYPGRFAEGEHSPEKLMVYSDPVEVDGIVLAGRYDTFTWDADTATPGQRVTEVEASAFELGTPVPLASFARPEGAVISPLVAAP